MLGIYASLYRLIRSTLPPAPEPDSFDASKARFLLIERGSSNFYKEIGIISGKGGTVKTTAAASLAFMASNKVMADNAVDDAYLHLLLDPSLVEAYKFIGGKKYRIDPAKCTVYGLCL